MMPTAALSFFLPTATLSKLTPLGGGNINDTWRVDLKEGRSVILQRLHPSVFPDPGAVMHNMRLVTGHLARSASPGSPVFFRLLNNPEGQDHWYDQSGHCWRLLSYIDQTRTLSRLETRTQAEEVGNLLACFHLRVAGLDHASLRDPLPGFHVTPRYLEQFDAIGGKDQIGHDQEAYCYGVIAALRPTAALLEEAREQLTFQVIHGDPKTANFLFAVDDDRAVSLIDLDTVKPGLLLHDLGDCLRSCCNRLGETEGDPAEARFDPDLFQALMAGYLGRAGHLLAPRDRDLLVAAVGLISFELGLRFFTDYLSGNTYFKVDHPDQNLHRAAQQFRLGESIRDQQEALERRLQTLG
ncbi:MAG: aminoglycoside phosphotransferase family protein [Desulfobulbaceae bacterium]|jgi:Ser/Thr protein kinase RdoA (MazF antagonist)|nr:aminoglycoside phosphotransferase family protein [Desulfobulbaceae bacterium]